jgi:hypothetical protein
VSGTRTFEGAGRRDATVRRDFTGPVFVVGMPRSGTKVLRDLLRGHPRIRIPPSETNLLPIWAANWHRFGDLSDRTQFARFYRRAIRAPYFLLMEKHTSGPIPEEVWYRGCRGFGPGDVFEALLRHDVGAAPESDVVWGDKSPMYTEHIDLLGRLYPQARFIHIVRDGRDCCLSAHNAWKQNMVRCAQKWARGVTKARSEGRRIPERYLEVRYEDLLANPEMELRRCCSFLDVEYDPSMVHLRFSTEFRGAAKEARAIVSTNVRKFEHLLDERTRRRIEETAGATLRAFGYDTDHGDRDRPIARPLMAYYYLLDAANYVLAQSRRSGFARAAQLQLAKRARA